MGLKVLFLLGEMTVKKEIEKKPGIMGSQLSFWLQVGLWEEKEEGEKAG